MIDKAFGVRTRNENFEVNLNKLDESQRAAVEACGENIVIRASAGSGKTSTLITAIAAYRYERLADRICAITYTRAARAEMEERLHAMGIFDVEVTTIHVWARNLLNEFSIKYDFKVKILEEMDIKTILEEIVSQYYRRNGYKTKINIGILYSYITGNKTMDITDGYRRILNLLEMYYIEYKRDNNLYDFTDYPLYLYDVMITYNEYVNNIDALFVDEFQDVDEIQFEIFKRVLSKKKFYIGDSWQCQPFGTQVMIRTKEGAKTKNIEDLKVGDPIVYYDQSQGYISGTKLPHNAKLKRILNIEKYLYKNDYLITIRSETGLESSYTSNHRTFVRFNRPQDKEAHVVYLMCDNRGRFRVGKIPLFYTGATNKSSNPWRDKMRAEGCTKIWLLKVFDNDHDARVEETKISYKYQIPQTCWQTSKVSWTKEDIDYIYEGLNTFYNAMQCLQDYGLNIAYPLLDENIEWQKRCHFTSNASSEIYAINLIPEFMSCLVFGSETSHKNLHAEKIIDVKKVFISEDEPICVCGLEVEGETYIADNIATHNSIFQFRGADGAVFTKLEDFDLYKLAYNYRSYQEIIDYASTVYLELKLAVADGNDSYISLINFSRPSSIICNRGYGGTVSIIDPFGNGNHIKNKVNYYMDIKRQKEVFNEFIKTNPMILCRTNKQVKAIQEHGYTNVSTIHQAKGLEYDNVIVIDTAIQDDEDLNVAYVALTRARDNLLVINWSNLNQFWLHSGGFRRW